MYDTVLPRRGTIHDMRLALTHKKEIIEPLFLQGKSVEQVMRETYHSAEAITRQIVALKQVLLCHPKGLSTVWMLAHRNSCLGIPRRLNPQQKNLIDKSMLYAW
jgi:hypothetical protein